MQGFSVSTDQTKLDFDVIYPFISSTYWAKGIPQATLKKAITNSLAFGVYTDDNQQVGFARVITDKATFAYLSDVFILPQFQGIGLAKLLMKNIVEHPDTQGLRRFMLATSDAHGLYAQFGFEQITNAQSFMQIWQPTIYQ
ncbi:GNAT family N-acetyltransferase [Vibrio porteresiae]|uniref:GNAT family N-acetyltransferase n=1 Tax=Vibrio porteresiae DSM 19223 TaxID=1123496 RepID=A0ABZ0QIN7_9VIBR|nr:GNAT family N-acetyltransferase [Vibrio porteresiae]WPC76361.1 GNAT family N-acetyltransferase [Vibrio porteresiae DSM 19223]